VIRYDEREGLLWPGSRSSGNYRLYGRAAAERLTFIGSAQAAGFELPEIRAILALETGRVACGQEGNSSLPGWWHSGGRC
jgi:DNA-binding transcriptional MerR regulator